MRSDGRLPKRQTHLQLVEQVVYQLAELGDEMLVALRHQRARVSQQVTHLLPRQDKRPSRQSRQQMKPLGREGLPCACLFKRQVLVQFETNG